MAPDAGRRVPLLGRGVDGVGDRAQREGVALVRAPAVERRHVRQVGAEDGRAVQRGEVVALQVAVDDDLPVGTLQHAGRVVVAAGEVERAQQLEQLRAQPGVEVELGRAVERDEDDAGPLVDRQRQQPHGRLVDRAERLLAVHAGQAAGEVVGPGVVGAGEATGRPGALGHELATAVPAGVHDGAQRAVALARDDDRRADRVDRLVAARARAARTTGRGAAAPCGAPPAARAPTAAGRGSWPPVRATARAPGPWRSPCSARPAGPSRRTRPGARPRS